MIYDFHDYKIAKEIDRNGNSDKHINSETKTQKEIEQDLGCELNIIYLNKEAFDIFKAINKIFRYIKQSSNQPTRKTLTDKISLRLLGLAFKPDTTIKSKAI